MGARDDLRDVEPMPPVIGEELRQLAREQLDVAGFEIGFGEDVVLNHLLHLGAGRVLRLVDRV